MKILTNRFKLSKLSIYLQADGEVNEGAITRSRRPSGFDIVIGLEDESGAQKPVEMDETDEAMQQNKEELTPKPGESNVAMQQNKEELTPNPGESNVAMQQSKE